MDVTVAHLRSFLAVAEELHFGRAAERLNVSPSSLSEHVATLERRLGRTLFVRTSRSVSLSGDGKQLIPLARNAVRAVDEVVGWARSDQGAELRVGVAVFSPQSRAILTAARAEMPEIQWQVKQLGFSDPYRALLDRTVDCALIPDDGAVPEAIRATPLWTDSCVLIVADGHPLASREAVTVAELVDQTFVTVSDARTSDRWLGDALRDAPRTLPIAHNFDEVLELCAAGIGVNIAGAHGSHIYQRPGVRFVPISDLDERPTHLCVGVQQSTPALRRFTKLAVRVARSSGFAE
ncbi:LysR substrate-binding domain-containing protein [Nocardia macrotermitis]|uniref:HTH-type transcriptional regulator HdfR n=1 Tax=Nocardia macrotermitis TaxID=2585198 RepID=A0A7K0DF76_9NOCA|nr:LysR substrate-binding domain-containing protein [Nocardia macrotermitis]MQY24181.1 HTH-type transcriptional regulator HdfR [Nocardia macrotermitis]